MESTLVIEAETEQREKSLPLRPHWLGSERLSAALASGPVDGNNGTGLACNAPSQNPCTLSPCLHYCPQSHAREDERNGTLFRSACSCHVETHDTPEGKAKSRGHHSDKLCWAAKSRFT